MMRNQKRYGSSIFLITSTKGYCSLVCKIHEIFTQTETHFSEQVISKLVRKPLRILKQTILSNSKHFAKLRY